MKTMSGRQRLGACLDCIYGAEPAAAIYIATHDQKIETVGTHLLPIQTGAALSSDILCEIRDDTGENISARNRTFCELTALYWIWKHDIHAYTGLSHYRRRFLIRAEEIVSRLQICDVILPPPYYFRMDLTEEYQRYHIGSDLAMLRDVLSDIDSPTAKTLDTVLKQNMLIPYNMFIAGRLFLNDYCQWLFPILFELEKRLETELKERNAYQKRIFGFLSERLLTAYIKERQLTAAICPVSIPETTTLFGRAKYHGGRAFNRFYFTCFREYSRNKHGNAFHDCGKH